MKKFAALLVPVILVSGCVSDIDSILAGIEETQTKELPPDLVTVENINVIPSEVLSGSRFDVSFEVRHQGDPAQSDPVFVDLCFYDWGKCTPVFEGNDGNTESGTTGSFSPWTGQSPGSQSGESELSSACEGNVKNMFPQQVIFVQQSFKAPSSGEIGGMEAECPIRFKVRYSAEASTRLSFDAISEDRYMELVRSGKNFYPKIQQVVGQGPVKIYFQIPKGQVFRSGQRVTFLVYAKNKGSGVVETEKSEAENSGGSGQKDVDLSVTLEYSGSGNEQDLTCDNGITVKVENSIQVTVPLSFVRDETPPVRCSLKIPQNIEDEKTLYVTATSKYVYRFSETVRVTVRPAETESPEPPKVVSV